ncbi:MAG: hypothetical protein ACR2Q4_01235 [Geminicoccaceae bacterium]
MVETLTEKVATEETAESDTPPASSRQDDEVGPDSGNRTWNHHRLNIRVSLPLPFGRWYFTLVGGPERRSKTRLIEERKTHSLDTGVNLMLLLFLGLIGSALLLLGTALLLVHGFGWTINLVISA